MKSLIFFVAMMTMGLSLNAEPVQQFNVTSGQQLRAAFEFLVTSPRVGLVTFGDFAAARGWPRVNGEIVHAIRWYSSEYSFSDISPESPFVEQWIDPRDGSIPLLGLGNYLSGRRLYFKVGLATREGRLVYFTGDTETDTARNSVMVR